MAPVLGIDLGTTNSVVCVADEGELRVLPDDDGNLLIPSVVSFHPAGDVIVGHTARERRLLDAKNTVYSIKRLIGRTFHSPEVARARERFPFELCAGPTEGVLVRARGETYTLPEISAFVLREVRRIAEARLGEATSRAVITVPANFNELQRSATKAAGRVAGLDVLRILNEPTAAALAYGYGKGSRERIAVFDLGGGTFDITILELAGDVFEVLSTAGDTFLGGDDIDVLIAEKMADAFLAHHRFDPRADAQAFERLRAAAEWAKCQLSSESDVQLRVEELAFGEAGASLDLTFGMTRSALEGLARPLIARAFDVCEDAMSVAGIRPTQLDNVILVGGSTRIPLVRQMVREYFGREPLGSIDPDLVVARGAALQASALSPALEGSGPKPLARVALRRVSLADMAPVDDRRADLEGEVARLRPRGPAFSPGRGAELEMPDLPGGAWEESPTVGAAASVVPQWESSEMGGVGGVPPTGRRQAPNVNDEPPTRVKEGASEVETRVARGEDLWSDVTGRDHAPEPSTAAGGQDYERAARASSIPPAGTAPYATGAPSKPVLPPPPPPSARRAPVKPVGGSTLGFGSVGLPVPDFGPEPPAAAPTPPAPPRPPPAPPAARAPEPRAQTAPPSAAPPTWSASSRPAPMPAPVRPPLLLDVTPHTLGVETVGGYCEGVIARNAAIPVEQTRLFSTAKDGQQLVSFRIFQGESRRLDENQPLGHIELSGLRQAARGQVTIEVTFVMDADGTLGVRARDPETGHEQTVRINLVGGVGDDEIQRMTERQAQRLGAR